MIVSTLICGTIFVYTDYNIVYTISETIQVVCVPHECFWGWAADLVYMFFAIFVVLSFINYVFVWIVLRYRSTKNTNNNLSSSYAWSQRILKTLCVIMFFNFVGLSMNSILRLTLPRLNLNITQRAIAMHSLSCLTVTVMSSNAPILFIHKFVLNYIIRNLAIFPL
ncbi:unnamed protein product [Meloidogyne enterolobii]|uniref:Uncharacterized protein n=1 Tax=Meloidogyne enterolobii TaxID=390850 RepID=A0ACB1AGB4_MELEN